MKRAKRNYIIYTVMLIVFALAMVWVAQVGKNYDGMAPQPGAGVTQSMGEMIYGTLTGNLNHPLSLLLLQIIAIMIAVRIFSYLFKYLGQPGVIGEIVAGIVLGPSVLGYFFPEIFSYTIAEGFLVGAVTAALAAAGDLIESSFKRSAEVKDSGTIVPGRGGILDSVDSIVMAAPVYVAILTIILGV